MSKARLKSDINVYMEGVGRRARDAARRMMRARTGEKDAALAAIADRIESSHESLVESNR